MCRLSCIISKRPVAIADIVTLPRLSIIYQSFNCRERLPQDQVNWSYQQSSLNGDGYGIGWYVPYEYSDLTDDPEGPCVFVSTRPAWSDDNLTRLSGKIMSRCIFAHVRAASLNASFASESSCHPFKLGRYMFMHNGAIGDWERIRPYVIRMLPQIPLDFVLRQGALDSVVLFALLICFIPGGLYVSQPAHTLRLAFSHMMDTFMAIHVLFNIAEDSHINIVFTDGVFTLASRCVVKGQRSRESNTPVRPASLYMVSGYKWLRKEADEDATSYDFFMSHENPQEDVVIISSEPLTENVNDEWLSINPNHVVVVDNRTCAVLTEAVVPLPFEMSKVNVEIITKWLEYMSDGAKGTSPILAACKGQFIEAKLPMWLGDSELKSTVLCRSLGAQNTLSKFPVAKHRIRDLPGGRGSVSSRGTVTGVNDTITNLFNMGCSGGQNRESSRESDDMCSSEYLTGNEDDSQGRGGTSKRNSDKIIDFELNNINRIDKDLINAQLKNVQLVKPTFTIGSETDANSVTCATKFRIEACNVKGGSERVYAVNGHHNGTIKIWDIESGVLRAHLNVRRDGEPMFENTAVRSMMVYEYVYPSCGIAKSDLLYENNHIGYCAYNASFGADDVPPYDNSPVTNTPDSLEVTNTDKVEDGQLFDLPYMACVPRQGDKKSAFLLICGFSNCELQVYNLRDLLDGDSNSSKCHKIQYPSFSLRYVVPTGGILSLEVLEPTRGSGSKGNRIWLYLGHYNTRIDRIDIVPLIYDYIHRPIESTSRMTVVIGHRGLIKCFNECKMVSLTGNRLPYTNTQRHVGFVDGLVKVSDDTIVSSGADCHVIFWRDAEYVDMIYTGHSDRIYAMAVDNDREYLYTGGSEGDVRVWYLKTRTCVEVIQLNSARKAILFLSIYNGFLLISKLNSGNFIWSLDHKKVVSRLADGRGRRTACHTGLSMDTYKDNLHVLGVAKQLYMWYIPISLSTLNVSATESARIELTHMLDSMVKYRTVSDTKYIYDSIHNAEFICKLLQSLGATCVLEGRPPLVMARIGYNPEIPTVMLIGHYDVVDDPDKKAWTLQIHEGICLGRGVADNKGPVCAHICAVRDLLKHHENKGEALPVNIVFAYSGDQETGSAGLLDSLRKHRSFLESTPITAVISSNAQRLVDGVPSVVLSHRGLIEMEVEVLSGNSDSPKGWHGGSIGGSIIEPKWVLIRLLDALVDSRGRPNVLGICGAAGDADQPSEEICTDDFGPPITERQMESLRKCSEKADRTILNKMTDGTTVWGKDIVSALVKQWFLPCLTIGDIYCKNQVQAGSNYTVIDADVTANISCRFVSYQDGSEVFKAVKTYLIQEFKKLRTKLLLSIRLTRQVPCYDGWEYINSAPMKIVLDALREVHGEEPLIINEGGSSPTLSQYQRFLPKVPIIQIAPADPGCNEHLSDENIRLERLIQLQNTIFAVFNKIETCKKARLTALFNM